MMSPNRWNLKSWCTTSFYSGLNKNYAVEKYFLYSNSYLSQSAGLFIRKIFYALILLTISAGFALAGPVDIPLLEEPRVLPKIEFYDASSNIVTLDKWNGKVVVLNIWATWCEPCRTEMPTLDNLQGLLGSEHFEVVALSIDEAGLGVVKKFFEKIGIKNLGIYIDPSYIATKQLKAIGLPTTILIDTKGKELGRLVGPAEWDTPEMMAFFEGIIASQF